MSDIHSSQLENANVIQLENESCEIMWDLLHACNFAFTRVPIADLSLGWGNSLCGRCFTKDSNENITLQILHGELKLFSESNASEKRQSMSL